MRSKNATSVQPPVNFLFFPDVRQRAEPDLVPVRDAANGEGQAEAVLDLGGPRRLRPRLPPHGRALLGQHVH